MKLLSLSIIVSAVIVSWVWFNKSEPVNRYSIVGVKEEAYVLNSQTGQVTMCGLAKTGDKVKLSCLPFVSAN